MPRAQTWVGMPVFAKEPGDARVSTFGEPTPPAPPPRPGLVSLLVAATAAEAAENALQEAKGRYHQAPTHENRKRLLEAVDSALEKELKFEEMWGRVSAEWFGQHS